MTIELTPEPQTCDSMTTVDPQTCGFVQPSIEVEAPWVLTEFEQSFAYDTDPFFHEPVLVVVSPPVAEDWEVPFIVAGAFDPSGGGGEDPTRFEETPVLDSNPNERNLIIGAGGPIGPH